MHAIDKGVFPDEQLLPIIPRYISEMYELGVAYQRLSRYVTRLPDYVFVVPHLIAGGADLVILNYVRMLRKLHPDWKILLIATDNTPSPWAERLPKDVDFMPFGEVCAASGIWQDLHLQLFARLIVQLRSKKIHIIQSALGFSFAQKYKSLLSKNDFEVYGCAFCEDIDDEGRFIGHIHSGLPYAYPALGRIFTDNQAVIDQLTYEYGFEPGNLTVHYQPAEVDQITPPKQEASSPRRILWASRISKQKRPDIVKRVAEKLDPEKYTIDVYGSLHNDFTPEYFEGVPALRYKGGFNGLSSIRMDAYDLFLYTSANDGVPNILLGVAACGIPIIASNAGGVGEFIENDRTGKLITPIDDIGAYLDAIEELGNQPDKAAELARNAQALLQERHSEAAFERSIRQAGL
jgi:glycosyltransferase involved in cell wall biosynthesis